MFEFDVSEKCRYGVMEEVAEDMCCVESGRQTSRLLAVRKEVTRRWSLTEDSVSGCCLNS